MVSEVGQPTIIKVFDSHRVTHIYGLVQKFLKMITITFKKKRNISGSFKYKHRFILVQKSILETKILITVILLYKIEGLWV